MFTSNTIGVQILGIFFLSASLAGLYFYGINLQSFFLILIGYFFYGCLGIVVTFHRYLTHHSYKTYPVISKLFALLGCLGGTGSSISWASIHVNHHLNSDKSTDPHSPDHKGLKIFLLNYEKELDSSTKWKIKKLITDPYHRFLHRHYFLLIIFWSILLFVLGGIYLVLYLHWIPATVTIVMSNIVNYVGHSPSFIGSYRRYNLPDRSVNNWLWSLPSWGETLHNTHHRFPKKFNLSERWWEIDISGLIIKLIKK
jgi:stearoyl-CoA desaturase (delta-9 desaturase)